VCCLTVCVLACACPGPSGTDAGSDAGTDAGPPPFDAGVDAGSDAGFDAGIPDAGVFDAGPPTAGMCGPTELAQSFGGSPPDASFDLETGRAIAVDLVGNVALTGTYRGPINFGGGALMDPGDNSGMFVALLDTDGDYLWSRGFADPGSGVLLAPHADGLAIASDAVSHYVVAAGAFAGTIDFGTGPLSSADPLAPPDSGLPGGCLSECATDIVVMKLSGNDGSTLWVRRFGGYDSDAPGAVALDAFGNVYVAGSTSGPVDFGDGFDASYGGRDIFLLALDADGGFLWQQRFGGPADDVANALAVDDAGFVLAGAYQETVDFGGGVVLSSFGVPDAFAVRLNAWGASLGASVRGTATSVALDSQGAAWVTGIFRGTTDGGLGAFTSLYDDGFVTKLSPAGARVFSRRIGGTLNDTATGVSIGPGDHPFITGSVAVDTIDFGGGPLTGGAGDDVFVLELDPNGVHQCSRRYPSMDGESDGRAIAVDPAGDVCVTGSFYGTFTPGPTPLMSVSGTDIFFAVFKNR
jgi:hypothetical protein